MNRVSVFFYWSVFDVFGCFGKQRACLLLQINFYEKILKNKKVTAGRPFLHADFFRSGTQRVKDSLIRAYRIRHDFRTEVHQFSVNFKGNLETLSFAEACLSFPECSEQFFGSLETQSRQQKKTWTKNIFSSRRKNTLKIFSKFRFSKNSSTKSKILNILKIEHFGFSKISVENFRFSIFFELFENQHFQIFKMFDFFDEIFENQNFEKSFQNIFSPR